MEQHRPTRAELWEGYKEAFCTPEAVHRQAVRRNQKRNAKMRKKELKRTKRRTRNIVIAGAMNHAIRDLLED